MKSVLPCTLVCLALLATLVAAEKNPELQQFQGRWEVVELVENGNVIPPEAIREWLPSGSSNGTSIPNCRGLRCCFE